MQTFIICLCDCSNKLYLLNIMHYKMMKYIKFPVLPQITKELDYTNVGTN